MTRFLQLMLGAGLGVVLAGTIHEGALFATGTVGGLLAAAFFVAIAEAQNG